VSALHITNGDCVAEPLRRFIDGRGAISHTSAAPVASGFSRDARVVDLRSTALPASSSASSGSDSSCGPAGVALPHAPPGDDQLPFRGAAHGRFFQDPWTRRRRSSISDLPTSAITDAGCGVLTGQRDHIALNRIDPGVAARICREGTAARGDGTRTAKRWYHE